jgi:hypothetical protein
MKKVDGNPESGAKSAARQQRRVTLPTLNTEKWLLAFDNWLNGHHHLQLSSLSDDDINRESIYGERG